MSGRTDGQTRVSAEAAFSSVLDRLGLCEQGCWRHRSRLAEHSASQYARRRGPASGKSKPADKFVGGFVISVILLSSWGFQNFDLGDQPVFVQRKFQPGLGLLAVRVISHQGLFISKPLFLQFRF